MSKSKFNPLMTASVMSAVYLAGVSNVSQAVVLNDVVSDNFSSVQAVDRRSSSSIVPAANSLGQQRYIIKLNGPAVARFDGNAEYSAIPRKGDNKLDVNSAQAQSYLAYLEAQQTDLLNSISNQLNRNVELIQAYQYAFNGLAVYLTPNEAESITDNSGVSRVILDRNYFLDTDAGPKLIGANNLWGRDGAGNPDVIFANGFEAEVDGNFGEGVVIGTLDTGTNFDHPSFAEVGGDGYVHVNPLGSGNFLGACDPSNNDPVNGQYLANYTCNNKLIGGYDFVHGLEDVGAGEFDIEGPEDENGHGSHTASTSGGNMLATAEVFGITDIGISGVAPHATHVTFDVCFNTADGRGACPGVSSIASVDQAIADGLVDVINFSIGGGNSPWTDPVSEAFLNATASGIYVATSSGNSGPGPATTGHNEPWTTGSGASTHNRRFSNAVTVTGPNPVPANLVGALGVQGTGPVLMMDMVGVFEYAGNINAANFEGCAAFPADSFDGLVAVISRGGCGFVDKVNNASTAGATGVIVHNSSSAEPIVMGGLEATSIPSVMVAQSVGLAMDAFVDANPGATVNVSADTSISLDGQADVMAGFSSRGPSPFEYNKPDVTAPGVNILAAFDDDEIGTGSAAEYGVISGTSMSSPHTAGSAALLKGMKPGWSVPEIKSALMMTAVTAGVTKEDGLTAADPLDRGAGRIQVDVASTAGLVMDETAFNFAFADPDNGGDPKTLNVPSITDYRCIETCTFQRSFRSVANATVTYNASLADVPGTVTPSSFTLNPGQFVILNVEVDGNSLPAGDFSFGELVIEEAVVFTPGTPVSLSPNLAIDDDGYVAGTGDLVGMNCAAVSVAGVSSSNFSATLDLGLTHTWASDLTLKLVNPNGDALTLFSALADGGGLDFDPQFPLSFYDGAPESAAAIGSSVAFGGVACDVETCEYTPFANAEPTPPATFADLGVGSANGDWMVCGGDSAGGDTGSINEITLTVLEGSEASVPALHLPMVIVGFPPEPEIDVTPTSLTQSQDPDTTNDQVLNIANTPAGGADLNWTITTDLSLVNYKIVDQPDVGTGDGIVSDFFDANGSGAYSADAMVLSSDSSIEKMFFDGFVSAGDVLTGNVTDFTLTIYNDNAGVPANNPEDGLGGEVYTLTLPLADLNLNTGDDSGPVEFNILGNDGVPLELAAGTYWVTAYANFTGANRWNWFAGVDDNPQLSHLIDPGDLFAGGFTDWTDLVSVTGDPIFSGLAYNASRDLTCGAAWLSTDLTAGSDTPGNSTDVTVTFDSAGLAPGDYAAAVCINSDDSDESLVVVPVFLTVNAAP